jgi:hypothetical protein
MVMVLPPQVVFVWIWKLYMPEDVKWALFATPASAPMSTIAIFTRPDGSTTTGNGTVMVADESSFVFSIAQLLDRIQYDILARARQ